MKIVKVKVASKKTAEVKITTENIRLDSALKLSNAVSTGGQAKWIIQDSLVKVNNEICLSRGKKLTEGDTFEYDRVIYKIIK
ncbi:MAG: RNA-binding S4 domain-containing protein [Clostridia bacterium]|nr:RNA-binding S4 domain-containing protein [Clostridia bacterium]MBQ7296653.1 RNA-binding S4 domain-containing protein [Clostridia bacterium]